MEDSVAGIGWPMAGTTENEGLGLGFDLVPHERRRQREKKRTSATALLGERASPPPSQSQP